ncbi:HAD-IIB family hydrolase [Sulfurovum sp. bin170]|uniref:HAD-IIB family hydrolase n=1 Tax=Sulfurovum sp. bin170 TaxID=2695268 RepID=UPI0013DF8A53|nr:HAD-IIB family hydrolase [Sulfurovum sp. bin170]NEW60574.1 HAD-IIB family hydrolase [Sulfurovum sp. bin170]
MQQLFITDLDHTFLHSSQRVTQFSRDIWNSLTNKTLLSVATARSFNKTQEFLHGMHLKAPLILLDGAMVVTTEKKVIDLKILSKKVTDAVIEEGKKFNIEPFIISLNDKKTLSETFSLPPIMNSFQSYLIDKSYSTDPRISYKSKIEGAEDTLKIVYMAEESLLRPLAEHLQKTFDNVVEIKLSPENYMGCWFLTILHPLGDKAHALHKVSEYLDIPLAKITVFGDSINDIEMFKIAGTSVAVSNALDEVKNEASIILPHSNDEDAVAKYLLSVNSED